MGCMGFGFAFKITLTSIPTESRIFQTGGANLRGGYANLLFGQIFAENFMEMTEIGQRVRGY